MALKENVVTLTLLIAILTCIAADEDIENRVYHHRIYQLGESANLSCYEENATKHRADYWILHNNTIINSDAYDIMVSTDVTQLYLRTVLEEDFGHYLCKMTAADGAPVFSRTEVYLHRDLWEEYDKNFYVGLIAAGVVLLLIAIPCAIYNLSQMRKGRSSESFEVEEVPIDGYNNPTFEANGEASTIPAKKELASSSEVPEYEDERM